MKLVDQTDVLSPSERQLLLEVKSAILNLVPDATLVLYGSAARGEREPESDYDILVLSERSLSMAEQTEISSAAYEVELEHGVVISTAVYSVEQWDQPLMKVSPYHQSVEREGILL